MGYDIRFISYKEKRVALPETNEQISLLLKQIKWFRCLFYEHYLKKKNISETTFQIW